MNLENIKDIELAKKTYLKYYSNMESLFSDYPKLMPKWYTYTKLNSIKDNYNIEFNRWLFTLIFGE